MFANYLKAALRNIRNFFNEDSYFILNFTEVKLRNESFNQERVEFVQLRLEHWIPPPSVLAFFPVENFTSSQFHSCISANQKCP